MKRQCWGLLALAALPLCAESVNLNPETAGGRLEQSAVIEGAVDVVVNDAANGAVGTVVLSGANTYTGATVVPAGILEVPAAGNKESATSLGSGGTVLTDRTILRFTGTGPATTDFTFTNAAPSFAGQKDYAAMHLTVFDLQRDVTFTGDIVSDWGVFAKTGPGTMTFEGTNFKYCQGMNNDNSARPTGYGSAFNPDDSGVTESTVGFSGFNIYGGTFRMNSGTLHIPTCDPYFLIGGWTAADGTQEPDVVFEQNGGTVSCATGVMIGYHHGLDNTTPNGPAKAILRVNGGTFAVGGGKSFILGDNNGNPSGRTSNGESIVEVHGGEVKVNISSLGTILYANKGISNLIWVDGGTFNACYSSKLGSGFRAGCASSGLAANTSQRIVVCTNGVFNTSMAVSGYHKSNTAPLVMDVFDGGFFKFNIFTNYYPKKSTTLLNVNGGVLGSCTDVNLVGATTLTNWFDKAGLQMRLGEKGVAFRIAHTGIRRVASPIVSQPETVDGGVVVSNTANKVLEFAAPMAYAGPTVVKGGYLSLHGEGALPSAANAVTLLDGGLMLRDGSHSVGTLTLGAEGEVTEPKLKVAEGAPLVVTGDLQVNGNPVLQVALIDALGNDLTEAKEGIKVLTVPASAKAALQGLRVSFDTSCANGAVSASVVDDAEGTCSLVVTTALKASFDVTWTNSDGGSWTDTANWLNGIKPANVPGVIVRFKTTATTQNAVVTIPEEGVTVGQLLITASSRGYRFMGGPITMDNLGRGAVLSTVNGSSRNRLDSDLVLNDDTRVPYVSSVRRWTFAGKLLGTGLLTFGASGGDSLRVAMDGVDFAADPSRVVFEAGTSYGYTPRTGEDKVDDCSTDRILGGYRLAGNGSSHHFYVYDGTLTITAGVAGVTSEILPHYVKRGDGTLRLGQSDGLSGTLPVFDVGKFLVYVGCVEFNSGTLTCDTLGRYDSSSVSTQLFNGVTLKPRIAKAGVAFISGITSARIGARGLTIDTAAYATPEEGRYSTKLDQTFEHDPDLAEGVSDGGITIFGPNRIGIGDKFALSTFTGPVTVKPGAGLLNVNSTAVSGTPGDLILGEEGATERVELGLVADATSDGVVVQGNLQVLSGVKIGCYEKSTTLVSEFPAGAVLKLVTYNSEKTPVDPDLNLFSKRTELMSKKLSYEIVTLTEGDYAGWKQVRATVLSGTEAADAVWTATSTGGNWSESANWNGGTPPNDVDDVAYFNAAAGQNVGVVVPEGTKVGALTIAKPAETNLGYSFTGSALAFETSHPGTAGLSLLGGTAQFAGVALQDDLALRVDTNATFTAVLTGAKHVTVNADKILGGGKTVLNTSNFTGGLTTGSGTVELDNLGFVGSAGDLVLSTGTLDYTGPSTEIAGLTTGGNANYKYTSSMLKLGQDVTLTLRSADAEENSMGVLAGNGTLRLKGTGTFNFGTLNSSSGNGTYTRDTRSPNGDSPRSAVRAFNIANGRMIVGTLDDPGDAPTVNCGGDFALALASTKSDEAVPEFEMNNGILNCKMFYMGYKHAVSSQTRTTKATLNGGAIRCTSSLVMQEMNAPAEFIVNGGSFSAPNMYSARAKGSYGRFMFTQNGGSCVFTNVHSQYSSSSYTGLEPIEVSLKGGTFTCLGIYDFSKTNGKKSRLTIQGGDFSYGSLALTATTFVEGRPEMRFNGGTVRPLAAGKVENVADLYVSTNATTFTTAGYDTGDYEFAQALLTDPSLNGAADGGLVKAGANDLVLSAANTFTGPLVVQEGAVRLGTGGSLAGPVALNGTTLVAPNGVSVPGLFGAGTVNGSLATAVLRPDFKNQVSFTVTGDLTLSETSTIDVTEILKDDPLAIGDKIPLCRVAGTCTIPSQAALVPDTLAGYSTKAKARLTVEEGVLYATIKTSGMMILFR